jgi:shikimate dehydrogenase
MASPITLCGSLSLHPVTLGAALHSAGYRALGLDWVYLPFAVKSADLDSALRGMRALGIRGFGVSMPFKLEVIPLLDGLDELARRIGAVNTIVNDDGVLTGHNTDAVGSVRALREVMELDGRRLLVIGAGGAARAVVFALAAEGARVRVVNRSEDKAARLAKAVNETGPAHEVQSGPLAGPLEGFDAWVNCSSATMSEYGGASPLPEEAISEGQVVMDIVYKPLETALVLAAERRGARAVHGGRMLLHQAARQFELYTGRPAPLQAMDAALVAGIGQ